MAELYEQPKLYANRPSGVTPISGDPDLDKVLAELPPEEREMAMQKITAPPTGEEIAQAMQERNANGELFNMTLDQYRLYKAHQKNKEVDIISTFGQAASGIYDEITKAGESIVNDPTNAVAKLTPSLIEAFAQGTRNLYGMAAQSVDPSSVMFRMKNALSANGSDEEAEYRQFMEAQQFNVHSMNLMSGKETLVMDKDVINPEMTQVMSYVADPTLFIPFGGIAMKGARMVGMGEGLAKASARASMIRNKVLGGTLKWGVGAPIEFMGSAVRNTIDYGLERGSQAFEFATGMPAAEARATAQMYGLQSTSAALSGQTIPLPVVGNIAGAMVGSTTARGVGEAFVTLGDQIYKQSKHGRGVLSYAGQALRDTEKSGVVLSNHAKGLLKVIDMADPLFVYSADIAEGAVHGMGIGGGLGYLAGGEEGMASGAGAGFALGTIGAGLGSVTADVTNNRLYDRIAIQRKMVIEGLRGTDDVKASALEAFAKVGEMNAERTGNRRLQAEIDGMIAGIDIMTPNAKFNIRSTAEHTAWLKSLNIDPKTGRLKEASAILPQFGSDRKQRASALSFLSMVSDNFSGLPENLKQHIDSLPADHAMKKHWARLSDDVKKVVMDEVKQNANIEYRKQFGGKKANEFYGDINYAEAHTARINSLFDSGNPTQAKERINMLLKEETKGGKLTKRGELLKEKLATEGYFDKDGNMRPSRLKDVEITEDMYKNVAGFVIRRDSTGQVEINLNLSQMGRDTAVHELFHAIMLESPMKDEFIDRLSTKLLGKFDANGKRIEGASVDTNQVKKFFQRYIDSLHRNNPTERANETKRLERAIEEYEQRGDQNKVNRTTSTTLEDLVEEFGAFYFPKFIQDKPVDYLFRGGELGAMREMFQSVKFGWLDFWRDKVGTRNPELNFDAVQGYKISQAFGKDGQPRYKNKALDLFMQDFVRATAMANRNGQFDITRLSNDAQKTFIKNNGIRGYGTIDKDGKVVRLNRRTALKEEMRVGKEIYKIVAGIDPKYRQGLTIDGEGNFSGRISPELAEELVKSGHVDRAWVDKLLRAYDIVDGKGSNVIEFGYLGRTAQIGDYAWPRLVGSDVPFKNRKAILLDVDFKIGKDGRMTALYHTLDHAVIEGRANTLWSDPAVRQLWDGDRGSMEADFFRYLSNASLPSDHPDRVSSAKLLEDGTGKGAMRRNAMHQMLGMAKLDGDVYINKPIAEIPLGIRHSVTTFNVDGVSGLRVREGARYDYNHRNAFRDLSRNFMMSEMASEETPNGKILKHGTGYKITKMAGSNRFSVFDVDGKELGRFDTLADAGRAAQKDYNTKFDAKVEGKDVPVPRTEIPPSRQAYIEKNGKKEAIIDFLNQEGIKENVLSEIDQEYFRIGNNNLLDESTKQLLTSENEKFKRAIEEERYDSPEVIKGFLDLALKLNYTKFEWNGDKDYLSGHFNKVLELVNVRKGKEYDAMYPMEIKSALHGRLAQIFQDYPNLTAQGLLKKLDVYGSQGYRYLQEAKEIGLVDLLKSKIKPQKEIYRKMDASGNFTGEVVTRELPVIFREISVEMKDEDGKPILDENGFPMKETRQTNENIQGTQPVLDMQEILDFAKSKEIKLTIEEGAKEVNRMNTERLTLGGDKSNYKETAVRINPEYAHGIQGHYGENTVVHFRTTERLDAEGNKVLFIEEVQANNPYTDETKSTDSPQERIRKKKKLKEILQTYETVRQEAEKRGRWTQYDSEGLSRQDRIDSGMETDGIDSVYSEYTNFDEYLNSLDQGDGVSAFGDPDFRVRALKTKNETKYTNLVGSQELMDDVFSYALKNLRKHIRLNLISTMDGDIPEMKQRLNDLLRDAVKTRTQDSSDNIRMVVEDFLSDYDINKLVENGIKDAQEEREFLKWARKYENNHMPSVVSPERHIEIMADYKSRLQQLELESGERVLPMIKKKDWTLTALKGIIRQAIRDGLDTITLTHPDDSPTVSNMDKDARHGLYGKIIPDTWGSWLRKYGIEIGQQNKLRDVSMETARGLLVEVQNKIPDANKAVMDRFQQVMTGEDPAVIKKVSELLSTPVHEADRRIASMISIEALGINDNKLRDLIGEVALLKGSERDAYSKLKKIREGGVRAVGELKSDKPSGISAEAIDRGMTFKLNDAIKRDFLDGKIKTHAMPEEGEASYIGGRTYNHNSKEFKFNFIGKQAEDNQDLIEGKNLEFVKRKDGSYRITLTDNSKQGETAKIGQITARPTNYAHTVEISSSIAPEYRGKKLANIFYSEMAERLRSMGVQYVDGTIVNKDGIPVQVRNTVIGQTYFKGSNKPASREETAKRVQAVQSQYPNKGVGVYNELDPNAHYQPSEAEKAPVKWIKDRFYTEGYNSEVIWMTPERFLKLASPLGDRVNDEASRARIDAIKRTLQREGSDMDMPYFQIMRNEDGELQVSQHEGRHRAIALLELYGDKKIPVELAMTEGLKLDNIGDRDWDYSGRRAKLKPESERKKGTVSKEFKALEDTPLLNQLGTGKYQPAEGGRTYNKKQMDGEFIGRQAYERTNLIDGVRLAYRPWDNADGKDEGRKKIILTRSADGAEIGRIDFDYDHLTKYGLKNRGFGENENGGIVVDGINVKVSKQFQGKGYQHILYSEMFERARALGAVGFSQSIENKQGLPLKSVNRVIGEADNFIASLAEPNAQKPTQENFDRLMAGAPSPTGNWMSNEPAVQNWGNINPKAWYMMAEGDKLIQNGFEKSELNEKLIKSGHIVLGFDERELAGKAVVINNPDTMMTGELKTKEGKTLVEGEGGLNFVSKFADIWANSVESKAKTTASKLKKSQEENGGVAYLALTRGELTKALNSHTGAKAGMSILEYFVDQGYISLEEFRNALKDSGRKYGIEFNATQSAKAIHAEIAQKFFGVSDSSFDARGSFVEDVITHLAKNGESGHKNIEKIRNALGSERLGRNIEFAPKGIREAIGLMISDKRANVDPSHIYAYIEVTGNISVEKTENGHKSYPFHIVQRDENGNKIRPRMLIPDKTNYVTDVMLDSRKQEVSRIIKDKAGRPMSGAVKLGSNRVGEAYGYVKSADKIPEGKERLKWMPAEGWRDWQSERTSVGSVIKNTAGYLIMVQNGKFKVYNPAKAMIGIYDNEEQAKRRVQKDEPRQ